MEFQMKKIITLITIVSLFITSNAFADYKVLGVGGLTCADYNKIKHKKMEYMMTINWIHGNLTAYDLRFYIDKKYIQKDLIYSTPDYIKRQLKSFCQSDPTKSIEEISYMIYLGLPDKNK